MSSKQICVSSNWRLLGQEILTKDKATLRANLFVQYKIADLEKALIENKDALKQLYVHVQMAFREYIGNFVIDELLMQKEPISQAVEQLLKVKSH